MRNLDTYFGRRIVDFISNGDDPEWYIVLDGDVKIISTDPEIPKPRIDWNGTPLIFATLILSNDSTQMVLIDENRTTEFRILLNPTNYTIYDVTESPEAWSPQTSKRPFWVDEKEENEDLESEEVDGS